MTILHKLSNDDIEAAVGDKIARNIINARDGKMAINAGGGGNYRSSSCGINVTFVLFLNLKNILYVYKI